ncbi:MAG: hypothetical protein EOP11_17025, partial [Proteobacteria bacterium]
MNVPSRVSSASSANTFKQLCASVSLRAARFGKTVRGFRDPALPLFSLAPPEKQALILASLALLDESLDNEEEKIFFEAEKRALWKAISLLGFVPPHDLFEQLKPDRAIEIFGLDGGLIWRNLTCMDLCSYTLEELACIDVFERYQRPPGAYDQCVANVRAMISGQVPEVIDPKIPAYPITELMSAGRLILRIKHELAAVLKNRQGGVSAWLVMSDAKVEGADLPKPAPMVNHL